MNDVIDYSQSKHPLSQGQQIFKRKRGGYAFLKDNIT